MSGWMLTDGIVNRKMSQLFARPYKQNIEKNIFSCNPPRGPWFCLFIMIKCGKTRTVEAIIVEGEGNGIQWAMDLLLFP